MDEARQAPLPARELMVELLQWRDPAIEKPNSPRPVLIWLVSNTFTRATWDADSLLWDLTGLACTGDQVVPDAVLAWADVGGPFEDADEPWERDDDVTFAVLQLVGGHDVPFTALAAWTDEQCMLAEEWAGAVHAHASDNDHIEVPPMPAWVAEHCPKVPA